MELLYVLLIIVCLALIGRGIVLFIGWRSSLRLKIEQVPPGLDPEVSVSRELGKVRIVHRAETLRPVANPSGQTTEPAVELQGNSQPDESQEIAVGLSQPSQYQPEEELDHELTVHDAHVDADEGIPIPSMAIEKADTEEDPPVLLTPAPIDVVSVFVEQHDMFANEPIAPPPDRRQKTSRAQALYGETSSVEPVRPVVEPTDKPPLEIEQVIALHVVCRTHPFNGEDLLRHVLSYGLRFGNMSIFHRHEQPSGRGSVLFSMAKAVEPGTFDLELMTGDEIPGVTFFLGLPGVSSIAAYDIMVDTARRLAIELQGDVLDEHQQPLTRQLIEHYRERVQEFERRRLMPRSGNH